MALFEDSGRDETPPPGGGGPTPTPPNTGIPTVSQAPPRKLKAGRKTPKPFPLKLTPVMTGDITRAMTIPDCYCGKKLRPKVDWVDLRYCSEKCRNRAHVERYWRKRLGVGGGPGKV